VKSMTKKSMKKNLPKNSTIQILTGTGDPDRKTRKTKNTPGKNT